MNKKKFSFFIPIICGLLLIVFVFIYKTNNVIESDWLNYLLERDIQEIIINQSSTNETKRINVDDLRNIFSKIDDLSLKKVYSGIIGESEKYLLSIYYIIDEIGYYLVIKDNKIELSNDSDLMNLLNESYEYNEYDESSDDKTSFYYFALDNFEEKIFKKYFSD